MLGTKLLRERMAQINKKRIDKRLRKVEAKKKLAELNQKPVRTRPKFLGTEAERTKQKINMLKKQYPGLV